MSRRRRQRPGRIAPPVPQAAPAVAPRDEPAAAPQRPELLAASRPARSVASRSQRSRGRAAPSAEPFSSGERTLAFALGAAVALGAAALYIATAARDIVVGDSPEFVTVAFGLGVAHPPGYPLLSLLGALFTHLPLDPLPFRVNLLAVVCDTGAVALVYASALQLVRRALPAAAAAALLATSPLFWTWSLAIEAFPLNNLLAAALLYFVLRWHERPDRSGFLYGAALCGGLGLANHQTIVLLGPAVLYLLWRRRRVLSPRLLLGAAGALLLGLLPYAYIPWAASRGPAWNWGGVASLNDLAGRLLRSDYGSGQLVSTES